MAALIWKNLNPPMSTMNPNTARSMKNIRFFISLERLQPAKAGRRYGMTTGNLRGVEGFGFRPWTPPFEFQTLRSDLAFLRETFRVLRGSCAPTVPSSDDASATVTTHCEIRIRTESCSE